MLLKKNISCPFLCGSRSAHQDVYEPAIYNPLGLKGGQFNFNKRCDLTKLNFFLNASIKDYKKDSFYVYELPDGLKHNKISEVLKFIENCAFDRQSLFQISVEAMAEFIFYSKMQENIAKQLSEYWDDINLIYDLRINAQLDSKTIFDELFNYKTFLDSLEYIHILEEMSLHPFQVRFLNSSQIETLFEDFSSKLVSTLFESLNRDDGQLNRYFRRKRMKKLINDLSGHLIVCGAGNTGQHIIQELYNTKKEFVVIEQDKEVFESLQNKYLEIICIHGDATKDEVLEEAGIEKAKAIAAVLPYDKDNLFLTITAKQLNAKIRIISKIMNLENKRKMIRAGATSIVPPQFIGALRLVSEMVRPKVVGFLDNMLRDKKNLRIEEIDIPKNSWTIGKELKELDLRKNTGLQILAFQDPISQAYNYSPQSSDIIQENMTLITMGNPEQILKLEKFIK